MKWLRIIAAAAASFTMASYAWAQAPEGLLGAPLPKAEGTGKPASGAPAAAARAGQARTAGVVEFGKALNRLRPESRAATRGAAETRIYQLASPAVVLIVTKGGIGSGVLISADGKIVTNHHVVEDNAEVGVIFKPMVEGEAVSDANLHRAKVLRVDEVADLALIQVSEIPGHVKPLTIGSAASVQVGADVHAIGHPTGQAWTYTRGIVSQIRRDYEWENNDENIPHKALVIQTQTPINPGNSGGPLIDDKLQVVGINSFKGGGEGLNFAVSADDVKAFLARNEDRRSDRSQSRLAKAKAKSECEVRVLQEKASKEPAGVEYVMDGDCDGKADFLVIEPKDRRKAVIVMYDDDGNGEIDTMEFDQNRDGQPEDALYDTDGDGKPDLRGFFRKGEDEPYRWEKVKG